MVSRFFTGRRALVSFERTLESPGDTYDSVFWFRPPFGPYPPELHETFPIGQSELPDWDSEMVRTGCKGIRALLMANPGCDLTVRCQPGWVSVVRQEIQGVTIDEY